MQTLQNKEENNTKQRDFYLDWICGLMILQMIFGHILNSIEVEYKPGWFEANHILSFFMPWFFFKSGMFFNSTRSWNEILKSSWKRLMVPFIVFSVVGYLVQVLRLSLLHPEVNWKWYVGSITQVFTNGFIAVNSPLWYLLSLFIIRLGYFQLSKKGVKDILLLLLSAFIPFSFYAFRLAQIPLISHTALGMFFFVCGHYLKNIQFNTQVFIASILVAVSILLLNPSHVEMFTANLEYGNYLLYFPYSIGAVIAINNLMKITPPSLLLKVNLSTLGMDSMSYLVTHYLVLEMCKMCFEHTPNLASIYKFYILLFVLCVTLPVFNWALKKDRYRWMIGN